MRSLFMVILLAQAASAQSLEDVRATVTRALPILQRSAGDFVSKRTCVSCHHNSLSILTFRLARSRGFPIDARVLGSVEEKTFRQLRSANALDDVIQSASLNDPTPTESYMLMSAHAAGLEADLTTAMYVRRLAAWQRDGHWITSDFRPPEASSPFTATATAVRAMRLYMPAELRVETEASIQSAREWMVATPPISTEDAAFRLLGLVWAGAPPGEVTAAQRDLLGFQDAAGGWAQLPNYAPDAYATGEALFALHEAGMPATAAVWQKGQKFLISTQAPDGTWRVPTRMISPANVSPVYFQTGFPYRKDEFLSYAGSCWAVMALVAALPESARAPEPASRSEDASANIAPWVRTALLGTAAELGTLLDNGLDPNSKTNAGTTLLMTAAPDVEKVRLLLARGADLGVRSESGFDALTVTAAYRNTAASVRLLIEAGAEVEARVRVRRSPLVMATMIGDLENVKLLLAEGAIPSAEALSQAVTFGYAEIVRNLISSGADAGITERTGINLLHWAVITNRPSVIPVLVEAGVPLDDPDEAGFTPLMYAATIDFGETSALKELIKAGADKQIPNPAGRTALQQAGFYKHPQHEAALR